jgi:hypothetical protein
VSGGGGSLGDRGLCGDASAKGIQKKSRNGEMAGVASLKDENECERGVTK